MDALLFNVGPRFQFRPLELYVVDDLVRNLAVWRQFYRRSGRGKANPQGPDVHALLRLTTVLKSDNASERVESLIDRVNRPERQAANSQVSTIGGFSFKTLQMIKPEK